MNNYKVPRDWDLRSSQKEAITRILAAYAAGKSIVVLQAPTGSGKSLIGRTVAMNHDSSYLLTPLISLQEQYDKDFRPDVKLFKGKAHYTCNFDDYPSYGDPVNEAACQDGSKTGRSQIKRCRDEKRCHYYVARDEAAIADCTLMNFMGFTVWMELRNKMPELIFDTRTLHVIDEAHKIEEVCRSYLEFKINRKYIDEFHFHLMGKFPDNSTKGSMVREYISDLYGEVFGTICEIYRQYGDVPRNLISEEERTEFVNDVFAESEENEELKKSVGKHTAYYRKINKYLSRDDYAVGLVNGELTVQPTDVSWFIRQSILGHQTLMMSATIPKDLILTMGFTDAEVEYIEMDSTFPKEKRPIFLTPAGNMNGMYKKSQDEKDALLANACSIIDRILEKFQNDKGIIHVNSYETVSLMSEYVKRYHSFTHGRMIFQQPGGTRDALSKHTESSEPTILVTPSMKEGVDLKEELSRVQIIYKCPYPSLAEPAMKALSKSNQAWYRAQTLANFMQMYGRSIRSETDWAKTYILDQALIDFLRQNMSKMPRYISEAIHWR